MQPRLTTTISILSLSTVTGITTVITGIIPQLKRTFPTVPTTLIEWLVTIANCSALITLLLNPRLTSRWGLRPIVISGLLISAIMGLIPAITTNFTVIMVSRLGLGLGVGLFSPHAISLLTHSFTGDLRARLLGYQTGLSALGNAILLGFRPADQSQLACRLLAIRATGDCCWGRGVVRTGTHCSINND
ncbi:MFS transporter [Lactiplantibacillus plantarum]|uniref:MFS transporter n=1 Tax=Lactiplantibacillus plantarum TaxID=1590 RepID=UPI001AF6E81F|nr:MFS transporter [Lactiplantibacillus plantarum]QRQ96594.1 hypothetical protein Lp900_00343 [Lactiplantibacillus plantarum]